MFKKLTISIVIVISFMVTLVGMEPDICPKFNTADDVNSFLFQLKKTGRNHGLDNTSIQFQRDTWMMSNDSYIMFKGSILAKDEESISTKTMSDYFIVDEIQFVRKEQLSLFHNTRDIICHYNALGTGRKNSELSTFNNPFYLRNASYKDTEDDPEYSTVHMFTHKHTKGEKERGRVFTFTQPDIKVTKNTRNPIYKSTTTQGTGFKGNWEETFKLNNGATVLHTPNDIVWKPVAFMTKINPLPGTSIKVNDKQIIFPNLQPDMSREEFVAVLKDSGYYDGH